MNEIIGYLAAFCTTIAFIPQAYKVYHSKRTGDISLGMFSLMTTGVFLWLVFGIVERSNPIIAANAITLTLAAYILFMKIKLDLIKKQI